MPFDKDSGLVFRENIVPGIGCRHHVEHQSTYTKRQKRPKQGTNTLLKTAMNSLIANVSSLDSDSLEPMPKHMVEMLWSYISRAGADSLHAWRVFARAGHFTRKFVKYFDTECVRCSKRLLGLRIPNARDSTLSWLTTLTLSGTLYEIADFVDIAKLKGLRNLYVQDTESSSRESAFSDRVLKAWAVEAKDHGALSKFEALFVDGQDQVTSHSLKYLNCLPALTLFCTRKCTLNHERYYKASEHGWRVEGMNQKGPLYQFLEKRCDLPFPERIHWADTVRDLLRHRMTNVSDDIPTLWMIVRDTPSDWELRGSEAVALSFAEFVTQVACFERDRSLPPVPEANHGLKSGSKRRKLNHRKSGTFDSLLDGFT